jgi:hypothetical protein
MYVEYDNTSGPFESITKASGYAFCLVLIIIIYYYNLNQKKQYLSLYLRNNDLKSWKYIINNSMPFSSFVASFTP